MEADATQQISCVSLGMLIMDEIRMPNRPPLLNVIGGSSTFVTLGLRLFADDPASVGCLVLAGSDFPAAVEEGVQSWGTTLVLKKSPDKRSSRGLLVYEDNTFGPKTFEYTTPPIRAAPSDLVDTPLLSAKAFHFFGRPEEILEQVPELLHLRHHHNPSLPHPFVVWEPLPSSCTPSAVPTFLAACKLVHVFSPNHLELSRLFFTMGSHPDDADTLEHLESLGDVFVSNGIGPDGNGAVVIRAGANGAVSLRRGQKNAQVPAFFEHGEGRVVDATGAGNAFLGGYVAGRLRGERRSDAKPFHVREREMEALCCGAVAASFALEQIGLPDVEAVNGEAGEKRLDEFKARLERKGTMEWIDSA